MRIGMDIGYSGVKAVYGEHGNDRASLVMPVGAAPEDWLGPMADDHHGGVRVRVGGQRYRAGIEPYLIPGGGRVLDEDYTDSVQYMALFHAVLKQVGAAAIDCLATGLPVNQYLVPGLRERLVTLLGGTHRIDGRTEVTVNRVRVFPQPVGAYITHVATIENGSEVMADKSVLIVDPGFFSVDSVVLKRGSPFPGAASTSTQAMSRVLELADEYLTREHRRATATPGRFVGDLERALRAGRRDISIGGQPVDVTHTLETAAYVVSRRAVPTIVSSMRGVDFDLDLVLFGGGGAHLFHPGVMEEFEGCPMAIAYDAPLANACGFYLLVS